MAPETIAPRKRGRPRGAVPVERDARRFEIAAYVLAKRIGLRNYEAGRIALIFFGTSRPLQVYHLGYAVEISTCTDLNYSEPTERVRGLIRKARRFLERPTDPDTEWVIRSAAAAETAWCYWRTQDWFGVGKSMQMLADLGWGDAITQARNRYMAATGGEPQPSEMLVNLLPMALKA